MSLAGIPLSVIEDETGWISVAAARRALGAIEDALGAGALTRRDTWLTHPENLGTYVRLLRSSTKPLDAYRFLAQNPDQASRIGAYDLTEISPFSVRMIYRLRGDEEEVQRHRLFCDAREGELTAIPRFWGQPDATVTHESCLAKGDPTCTYLVTWKAAHLAVGSVHFGGHRSARLGRLGGDFGCVAHGSDRGRNRSHAGRRDRRSLQPPASRSRLAHARQAPHRGARARPRR